MRVSVPVDPVTVAVHVMIISVRADDRTDHAADTSTDCRAGSRAYARNDRTRHCARTGANCRPHGSAADRMLSRGIRCAAT